MKKEKRLCEQKKKEENDHLISKTSPNSEK